MQLGHRRERAVLTPAAIGAGFDEHPADHGYPRAR
ncbi:hypothetical protein FB384_005183 [Prauserella sediminis]|uniref:Uncharacterized protein n=1 Tax=Prauserella sediminis TaxID=577680 RepID=A0A839XQY9_9PSEU|nr:hypothetical protein [Prauserella sediminis]